MSVSMLASEAMRELGLSAEAAVRFVETPLQLLLVVNADGTIKAVV